MKYPQDHLTNLLTADREKLTRICAEVCYGWRYTEFNKPPYKAFINHDNEWIKDFQPLSKTEKGRSQAFELAVKFGIWTSDDADQFGDEPAGWVASGKPHSGSFIVTNKDLQAAIVLAAILTAQQENNDE